MKKKIGVSLMLMAGFLLVGCADETGDTGSNSNQSAGSQTGNQTNSPADGSQRLEPEQSLLDYEGNMSGQIVSIQDNQIILAPQMFSEISDDEVAFADSSGDESEWIIVVINDDTEFFRNHIVQGVSQSIEATTFSDLFIDDTIRIAGELSGNTMTATEITVFVITH